MKTSIAQWMNSPIATMVFNGSTPALYTGCSSSNLDGGSKGYLAPDNVGNSKETHYTCFGPKIVCGDESL